MALTLAEKTQLCALAADSRKAEDILVLDVQPYSSVADISTPHKPMEESSITPASRSSRMASIAIAIIHASDEVKL